MNEKKISVIVPVYNTEKYIEKCLQSIMEQTYHNIEIIIVDDGSNDRTVDICMRYQQIDTRIVVLTKKNGGAGSARNLGLKIASGEYIAFVDSDDFIQEQMLDVLVRVLEDNNADISFCGVYTNHAQKSDSNKIICYDRKTALRNLLNEKILSYPVNKIYRKELWNGVSFPEDMTFEDLYIMPEIFCKANKVVEIKQDLYWYYFNRPDNVSSKKNIQHAVDCAIAFIHRYDYGCKTMIAEKDLKIALKKAVSVTIGAYGLTQGMKQYHDFNIRSRKFIRTNLRSILLNNDLDCKRKFVAIVIAYTKLYKWLYLLK